MVAANEDDWSTEYLAPVLSIKIVKDLNEAVHHIQKYGSKHTDSIVTEDQNNVDYFQNVDSSSVVQSSNLLG